MAARIQWAFVLAAAAVALFVAAFVLVFVPPWGDCEPDDVYCEGALYERHQGIILAAGLLSVVLLAAAAYVHWYDHKHPRPEKPAAPPPPPKEPRSRLPPPPERTADGQRVVSTRRPPR